MGKPYRPVLSGLLEVDNAKRNVNVTLIIITAIAISQGALLRCFVLSNQFFRIRDALIFSAVTRANAK